MRDLRELLTADPAWPGVLALVAAAKATGEADPYAAESASILPLHRSAGEHALRSLQVTDRSPMGSIALNCGGIVAGAGWLRVFGGGDPGLVAWNHTSGGTRLANALVVGADVLGGFFLLDGGGLGRAGAVHHLAADTLELHDLGVGYTGWLEWVFTGDTAAYYAALRWHGWEEEVGRLDWARGLHVYPPPWSVEGRDVGAASRRPVPLAELWALAWEHRAKILGSPSR
jgi:hypothetical protein